MQNNSAPKVEEISECECVSALRGSSGYSNGGKIGIARPEQTPLKAEGPPLC